MPWSYSSSVISNRDRVRLLIGDTNAADPQLQDEELDYFLASESGTYGAAAAAAHSLSMRYARYPGSKKMGDLSITYGDISKRYMDLSSQLLISARGNKALPSAGGVEVSDRNQAQNDESLVHSGIRTSIHDFVVPPRRPNTQ